MDVPPNPTIFKFIRWAVLGVLAYGLLHSTVLRPHGPMHPQQAANSSGDKNCDCDDTNPFSNFSALAFPVIPTMAPNLQVVDAKAGTGETAICGQDAVVRYTLATTNKAEIFDNRTVASKEGTTFRIGSGTMLPGIERGIIGMKAGGERTITLPPTMAFGGVSDVHTLTDNAKYKFESPSDTVIATVSLLSLTPAMPASDMKLRFLGGSLGSGPLAQCGNIVYADITIWKLDGTKLFSTPQDKPLPITLGAGLAPYGIEQGILGMREGSQRTLIIPPAYTQSWNSPGWNKSPPLFSFDYPHETVLAEVMLRPAPKPEK